MNSFHKDLTGKKRKRIRESEDETTENILEEYKNFEEQIKMLSYKQDLIFEKFQKERKEFRECIHNLEKKLYSRNEIYGKNLKDMENILKLEKEKNKKRIYNLTKDIDDLKEKFHENRKYINQLLLERKEDTKKIDDLKEKYHENRKNINQLLFERKEDTIEIDDLNYKREEDKKYLIEYKKIIDDLSIKNLEIEMHINELFRENKLLKKKVNNINKKVEHLIKFEFGEKLRKLIKNLIEYILNKYFDDYMDYDEIKNEVFFYRSPKYIKGQTVDTIIKALNSMLRIFYYDTKERDNWDYFVDQEEQEVKFDNLYHKKEKLFKNSKDFFRYFDLSQYENILNQIIPEEYLTTIDNFNFEIKIANLINKYKNKKDNK